MVINIVLVLMVVASTVILVLAIIDNNVTHNEVTRYRRTQERALLDEKLRQSNEAMQVFEQIRRNRGGW